MARTPLADQLMLLGVVARLAGGYDVSARRASASDDRNQVVHRQLAGSDPSPTVMTDTRRAAALPPLRLAELARSLALAADVGLVDLDDEGHLLGRLPDDG